ncbi:MAG: hypothetical protein BWY92_00451 [Firmicutes bacterium ADurb.BinA052]|nr:MAG: hypothetical protein BWY92_00451 [Firmicutes bacterium ADurb.BinA052]
MHRPAVFIGAQEKSELALGILCGRAYDLHDPLLQVGLVYADAPAAHLDPVEHQVVQAPLHPCGIRFQYGQVLLARLGKYVMLGLPAILVRVPLKQRKLSHPQKLVVALPDQAELASEKTPDLAQRDCRYFVVISNHDDEVAVCRLQPLHDLALGVLRQILGDTPFDLPLFDLERDDPLCLVYLGNVREFIRLLPTEVGTARGGQTAHATA